MIRKIKPAILILSCFLSLQNMNAQVQTSMTSYLEQKFLSYTASVPREEIFVHSDRTEYIAGEDLWFIIYLIDRQQNKPVVSDKIAYFELLDPQNVPLVQKKIFLENGFGAGQIQLPDTLSSGNYTIRAYTNWMKNFLPSNCFMSDIDIYNAISTKTFRKNIYTGNIARKDDISNMPHSKQNSGLNLEINNQKSDTLEILVTADNNYLANNLNQFLLFIETHGLINHISAVNVVSNPVKIRIPRTELIPGINHISVFNSKAELLYERFIYTSEKRSQNLKLACNEKFKTRDKVKLDLTINNDSVKSLNSANLSISVSPITDNNGNKDLFDYMVFGSEFGLISQIFLSGKKIDEIPRSVLDSLLLTVRSTWIDWEKILSGNLPVLKYKAESEGHFLYGKLISQNAKTPEPDEYLLLSTPGKKAKFQYARTDKDGNFIFAIHIDESVKDLIIQPHEVSKGHIINFESSFSDKYFKSEILIDSHTRPIPFYIPAWGVNYQVNKIYESKIVGDQPNRGIALEAPKRFYGKPDIELILNDYIKLPVMEEVFYELLPGVSLRNKKSVFELTIADPLTKKVYNSAPGMLIDGVIINDPSLIWNLDPDGVEKIDVVKERYFVGDYLFFGIVNVITNTGDFSSVILPDYAVRMPYRVLDPVWSFASPDYSLPGSLDNHIPDFRNTLYWDPAVKPDINGKATVEFWSSDVKMNYEVNIQGVTSEGKFVSFKKIIRVE